MVNVILQLIGAYLACIAAAVALEVPSFLIVKAGFVGVISYSVYLFSLEFTGHHAATFFACLVFSYLGHFLARYSKAPVTMFHIPAFFLYVPGTAIYRSALYFIQGDYNLSTNYLIQTLTTAGIIAVAVFLVDSTIEIYYHVKNHLKVNK